MTRPTPEARLLRLIERTGLLRPRDLDRYGIARTYLTRLLRARQIERAGRGLYSLPGAEVTEHHSLAEAITRVPHATVCLLSALRFHGLTALAPVEVWLAIDARARRPVADYPPLRVVRMRGRALRGGFRVYKIEGVTVRIYTAAKTVADCFKFRNKIGLDVALEALREYRRSRIWNPDELWRQAEICRVANVMRPYLEALG